MVTGTTSGDAEIGRPLPRLSHTESEPDGEAPATRIELPTDRTRAGRHAASVSNVLVRGQCRTPVVACEHDRIDTRGRGDSTAGRLVEGGRPGDGQGRGPPRAADGAVRRRPQEGRRAADRRHRVLRW